jgi:hypothetical protein
MMNKQLVTKKPNLQEFTDILERASLTTYHDPDLSSAAKFGLSKEFQGIWKLSGRFGDWNESDTRQLVAHLYTIKELSPAISDLILQELVQWPALLPESVREDLIAKNGH